MRGLIPPKIFKKQLMEEILLTENLQPSNLKELGQYLETDAELKKFLNTPAENLPSNYKYFVQEVSQFEGYTLYDIIVYTSFNKSFTSLISYNGNKPVGWVAYQEADGGVTDIKMFSFYPQQGGGTTLLRDLNNLIERFFDRGLNFIEWTAFEGNPANKIYQRVLQMYKGAVRKNDNVLRYHIDNPSLVEQAYILTYKPTGKKYKVKAKTLSEARKKVFKILTNGKENKEGITLLCQ